MRCVNCDFENMPGMAICVRCQSVLLADDVLVAPPRASAWRLRTAVSRRWHGLGTAIRSAWDRRPVRVPVSLTCVHWEAVFWSLVPGVGHIKFGGKFLGWLLLTSWLLLLLLSVLAIGLPWGMWLLAGAVFVHTYSLLAFLGGELATYSILSRLLIGLVAFLMLRTVVYDSTRWVGRQFYTPVQLNGMASGELLQDGDVVLCQGNWTRPERFERGDVVMYEIRPSRGGGVIIHRGFNVDRIVGMPGDLVDVVKGQLLVNGAPIPDGQEPLGGGPRHVSQWSFQLRGGEYLIVPSRVPALVLNLANERVDLAIERVSRVREEQIRGRVVLRLHPWSRFGHIE